ncbi:hypothetical protein [Thiohalophilus sp.]|nr:hypothetical protein [Thiohalophilus sp.]MDZ7804153.1 hypothetical protein [Thiohalophilus sp.]
MGWIIGGGLLVCCIAVPLLIRFMKQRRARLLPEDGQQGKDKDEE